MEKKVKSVIWTGRARKDLKKVYSFESKILGEEKAYQLLENLLDEGNSLVDDLYRSYLRDEAFNHLKHQYYKHYYYRYKLTYRESKDIIYINRVFDMRRNPKKNK